TLVEFGEHGVHSNSTQSLGSKSIHAKWRRSGWFGSFAAPTYRSRTHNEVVVCRSLQSTRFLANSKLARKYHSHQS
ncbi:hypothetical protein D047_3110B, partial [Vibrio parahaemolyticus VPTS-2010_2]